MTYVAPQTVVAGDKYPSSQHNIIVNDIIQHQSDIQAVSSSVSALAISGGGMALIDSQTFSATGTTTYTLPANAKLVYVECIGSGGGGGSGAKSLTSGEINSGNVLAGGGGGAGGPFYSLVIPAAVIGASASVVIGAGGTGGSGISSTSAGISGNPGATSSFGGYKFLGGRSGGAGNTIFIGNNNKENVEILGGKGYTNGIFEFGDFLPVGLDSIGSGGSTFGLFNPFTSSSAWSVYYPNQNDADGKKSVSGQGGAGGGAGRACGTNAAWIAGNGGEVVSSVDSVITSASNRWKALSGGGGAAGISGSLDGTNGTSGSGGGGGYVVGSTGNGGNGGNGGSPGGGGGGGAACNKNSTNGNGGNGGNAQIKIWVFG